MSTKPIVPPMKSGGLAHVSDQQRLLTVKQAATYINVSPRTLWAMASCGKIPSVRFGAGRRKSVRYDRHDLDDWIESMKRVRKK